MRKISLVVRGRLFCVDSSCSRIHQTRRLALLAFVIVLLALSTNGLSQPCYAQGRQAESAHLYFFTAHGCAPCRQVEPSIEALKREGYPITTVYTSEQWQLSQQLGVRSTPTVVLVSNNKIEGRNAGLIDAATLRRWFAAVGIPAGQPKAQVGANIGTGLAKSQSFGRPAQSREVKDDFSTSTSHQGTRQAANANEYRAMKATVRLQVEDPEGTSYATGTVIHNHRGECLVMTCGHVFREANGKGTITAEFGFGDGVRSTAPGQLIFYDAEARDIALVAIKTSKNIQPVVIAERNASVVRSDDIFTIGCDHGEDPTIRRSRIKNRAKYDGAIKYDIYGRPVVGRSGGGLFNASGELIGVCNAAAVEVDEGIYTALDTIYWQLAKVNLQHLFNDSRAIASSSQVDGQGLQANARNSGSSRVTPKSDLAALGSGPISPDRNQQAQLAGVRPVSWGAGPLSNSTDQEVIIIIRSKSNPNRAETITVEDPTPKLLNYLSRMNEQPQSRRFDEANLRELN
ncbi:MAG: trypsin-like peptidase domain-containing protein [Mariniblastus sp.]|nr:trypsin-like peptidase domain-containing protein [Mariniblastus sp.]